MKAIAILMTAAAAVFAASVAPAAAAPTAPFSGETTAAVHQRTGPGVQYDVVQTIPDHAPLWIYGCLNTAPWCDTLYAGRRGWVSSHYLRFHYASGWQPVVPYGFEYGIPLIAPWWYYSAPHYYPHHKPGGPGGPPCGVPNKPACKPGWPGGPPHAGPPPGGPPTVGPPSGGPHLCGGPYQPPCPDHKRFLGPPTGPQGRDRFGAPYYCPPGDRRPGGVCAR